MTVLARTSWFAPAFGVGRTRYLVTLGLLVLAYTGSAQLSYFLEFAGPVAGIAWLPVGVGIAFTYSGGLWLLPGVAIGDLLANDYTALPIGSAIGQSTGNVLEVAVATLLIHRLVRRGSPLDSVAGVCSLLIGIGAGVAVSASMGSLSLYLGHVVTRADVGSVWATWWLGDVFGALLILPLALAWYPVRAIRWTAPHVLDAVGMVAAVTVISELTSRSGQPVVYVIFPPLIWAALRFGQRGATLAIFVTAGVTILNTTHFDSVFLTKSLSHSVHAVQLFIIVSTVTTLFLAAAVTERRRYARDLARSRVRIVETARQERKRLERDLHDGAQQRLTWLAVSLHDAAADSPAKAGMILHHAEGEVEKAIDELRNLAHGLHPALTDLGLGPAVRSAALRTTIPVVSIDIPDVRLDERIEAAAYFVFAETVANAQKHSGANSIRVVGAFSPRALRIEVADDGRGGADDDGSGIQGMRDRVETLGGTLVVESPPGRGTSVVATLPLSGRFDRVR